MVLVDSHCHLDFPDFAEELDDIVARARNAGLARMVTISTKITQFERVRAIAERYDDVYCSVGIHPHHAGSEPEVTADELCRLADHPKVVGIGEAGLDYFYQHSSREAQAKGFRVHIEAARRTGLPIIVHTRDADEDTAAILEEEYEKGPFPGLLHCFSSGRQLAERAVKIGMSVSLSGIVTFKKSESLRDIVRDLPRDRILVETDAPYLAPVPKRGKRNEPAYVAFTAEKVAEVVGMDTETFGRQSTENFFNLFSKTPGIAA
ncbi:MAG: TatD family hydrolase [Alphaproteobacteria bacterium]|nr:TatD family hydrolase [Alphaproteobacteria bacterium]